MFSFRILIFIGFLSTYCRGGDSNALYQEETGQSLTATKLTPNLFQNESYCLSFTWLGPTFDESSYGEIQDKDCKNLFSKDKRKPICVDPWAITKDGTKPDMELLWQKHQNDVACRLTSNEICAKYSYYFNGEIVNVTRYCTKISVDDGHTMTSGCVTQDMGAYSVEVCACKSNKGTIDIPCNSSFKLSFNFKLIIVLFTCLYYIL